MAVFEWSGAVFSPLFFVVAMVPSPGHPCAQVVNFRDGRRQASAPGLSCFSLLRAEMPRKEIWTGGHWNVVFIFKTNLHL